MRTIAELNVLFRVQVDLPDGLEMATEEFREGWNFVRAGDARRIEKKIRTQGWSFVKAGDGALRSGVGDTSQEAISNALKLTLRQVSTSINAAEVDRIELTQYPWFFLARVMVNPYRIEQGTASAVSKKVAPKGTTHRTKLLRQNATELFPHFGSAMPMLKEMLVLSRSSQSRM